MANQTFADMLARVRSMGECLLEDVRDLVPVAYQNTPGWESHFLRNVVAPLAQMGLLEAFKGLVPLTADEVGTQRAELASIRLRLTAAAPALEEILGYDIWGPQQSVFGSPLSGAWPEVFVLMPFEEGLRPIFLDHIKTVAASLNLRVGRADDFFSSNSVVHEIWAAICNAKVVIADCTRRNPNVFYEIGLAHAIGKTTILISQQLEDIPFDLRHLRAIIYDFTPRGMREFEAVLTATLTTCLRNLLRAYGKSA
jgi:hypothetical protein